MYVLLKTLAAQLVAPLPITLFLALLAGLAGWLGRRRLAGLLAATGFLVLWLASWPPVARGYAAAAHFRAAGLHPIPAPTHYLAGRVDPGQLSYWVPSASDLRKTGRVLYEWMGRLAVGWEQ